MTPDAVAVAVMVILLFPMGYFTLASPAFLLVKLDIQPVAQLLRGMFNAHFLVMRVAGVIGALAFLLDGRLVANALKAIVAAEKPDVVLMGKQAVDGDSNPVGTGPADLPRRHAKRARALEQRPEMFRRDRDDDSRS